MMTLGLGNQTGRALADPELSMKADYRTHRRLFHVLFDAIPAQGSATMRLTRSGVSMYALPNVPMRGYEPATQATAPPARRVRPGIRKKQGTSRVAVGVPNPLGGIAGSKCAESPRPAVQLARTGYIVLGARSRATALRQQLAGDGMLIDSRPRAGGNRPSPSNRRPPRATNAVSSAVKPVSTGPSQPLESAAAATIPLITGLISTAFCQVRKPLGLGHAFKTSVSRTAARKTILEAMTESV
jgi:hypothetical protein